MQERGVSGPLGERWKWVPGYEGRYEVSDLGNLRSWAPPNGFTPVTEPRPMKSTRNYAGYHVVTLRDDSGRSRQFRLHCLVLEAFVGPRPDGHQGAHHDDDKDNNALSNLAWKTVGDNIRDRHINGRTARGQRSGRYKHGKFLGNSRKYYPPKYVADLV
jgi:NUMOD4 motif.